MMKNPHAALARTVILERARHASPVGNLRYSEEMERRVRIASVYPQPGFLVARQCIQGTLVDVDV